MSGQTFFSTDGSPQQLTRAIRSCYLIGIDGPH